MNRVGETKKMNCGEFATIIEYNNCSDIKVEFENGDIVKTQYSHFKRGRVKSNLSRTVYGIGFLGNGEFSNKNDEKCYKYWSNMLRRCYDKKTLEKYPTYLQCGVCEEWHNFQNFAKWFYNNYYEIREETMCLDKDILFKGNKVYSSETCIFVPKSINSLFVKNNDVRGEYPIGVNYDKRRNKFQASCSIIVLQKQQKHIGYYDTPEQAFYEGYKPFKEAYIKEVAEEYKDVIPVKLYEAMYRYKVEIDD